MFSLSTSWNSFRHNNGFELIDEIRAIGFDTVELNFALTGKMVSDVLSMKESGKIKVSSLHNMCPLPDEIEPSRASPDYYSLSSSDESERALAVEVAKNTIFFAKSFDSPAVVLHAGRVQVRDRTRELAELVNDDRKLSARRERVISERHAHRDGYLNNVIRSLEELVPHARRIGVALGIENRYYYREIPIMEELEEIFKLFRTGDLYYWHDVGHAEVFDRLGLASHRELLDKFAGRLIGVHLHDIIGPVDDHRAPGFGTFDFSIVKPYIGKDTIKVMEVHYPATAGQIRHGVECLMRIFK